MFQGRLKEERKVNDRFLRACRGEAVSPVPVWLMRQAGRYLPEYQEVRGQTEFLQLCKTPELAAEVTLQPVDILGVDAAILFSDILIPCESMGVSLAFYEGRGPVLDPPVRSLEQIEGLKGMDPAADVPFVLDTIRLLRKELSDRVPLIGFSGAPFTMATYMIEGGTSRSFVHTKKMLYESPDMFGRLMDAITDVTITYLGAQIEAGAQAVQVFDTWAGILSRDDYSRHALPYAKRIFSALSRFDCPKIYFVLDGGHLLDLVVSAGADVLGLDWRTDIADALRVVGNDVVVQGNMDPCAIFMPEDELERRVRSILEQGKMARAHIFNLGHGVLPQIPAEKVKILVDMVHRLSS